MKKRAISVCLIFQLLIGLSFSTDKPDYLNSRLDVETRVLDLLDRLTLEEKIGQMKQAWHESVSEELEKTVEAGELGSILGGRTACMTLAGFNHIQKVAMKKSRLGIPLIFGLDVNHGFKTIFPITLAQSCSWSPETVEAGARIAAAEARAAGIHWTFAPMVDVSRDPRWGRIAECYGEDTYLNSVYAAAAVSGFQGEDYSAPGRVAACLKHYVGYGASMGGRDYQYTEISERTLREVYLPPFRAGMDAGAPTLMSAFNDISGVPASGNHFTLTEVLRGEWGFDGFVLSDWNSVEQLIDHGFAADEAEAARRAVGAGVDMEMVSTTYETLLEQVLSGRVSEETINTAVERILRIKFRMGLFERPYANPKNEKEAFLTQSSLEFARKAARETMVLLKNDGNVLPLEDKHRSVAVLGPYADSQDLLGWWRCLGDQNKAVSVLKGMQENAPEGLRVSQDLTWSTGAIVLCVGEENFLFGENNNRADIRLPHGQETIVRELKSKGIPIVLVVFNGRPLDLTPVEPLADAILIAWHPGLQGGPAVADVLYGTHNPSGKLTATFPASGSHIPVYYNERNSGRPHQDMYWDAKPDPLYPFGYGLSYTSFDYSGLTLSAESMKTGDSLTVSATIQNTGERDGQEVVQLYIQDVAGSVTRPVKELKGFRKIGLKAGESKSVEFTLGFEQLSMLNLDMQRLVEPGLFRVWIAPNSRDGLKGEFRVVK